MIPYFQSTPFTTAASSLLTILHHYNNEPLTKQNEFHIWKSTANLPTRGSCIYALATYAKHLNPTIIVGDKNYKFPDYRFYRYTKEDIENAAFSSNLHQQEAIKHNIPIKEQDITLNEIKELLKTNHILLLRLNPKIYRNQKRNSSNYVVVHGYTNNYFHIIDPAFACLSLPTETIEESLQSLSEKKHRDVRMIVFPPKK